MGSLIYKTVKSFVLNFCLVLWIWGENSMYFYSYFTWFSNLSYLASYFLRTYCTHVLMLLEGPLGCRSWLKALCSPEVGGQRAGAEQLPSTHWTFVIYELFSMPSGARAVPWLGELLVGRADARCLRACSLPHSTEAVKSSFEHVTPQARAISLSVLKDTSSISPNIPSPLLFPFQWLQPAHSWFRWKKIHQSQSPYEVSCLMT